MMNWKPIETAPKSGQDILLCWRGCKAVAVGRSENDGICEGWRCDGDGCIPKNQKDCIYYMELPLPPDFAKAPPPCAVPPEVLIAAFVQGAAWWEFYQNGVIMWKCEILRAELEAKCRAQDGTLGLCKS